MTLANFAIKDPAIYFLQAFLLRPARETEFRLAPLYRVFEAWRDASGLSGYLPPPDAQARLERGGSWSLWSEATGFAADASGKESRWRARADTIGDDLCLLLGIETRGRALSLPPEEAARLAASFDAERARLQDLWRARTQGYRDAAAPNLASLADPAPPADRLRTAGEAWLAYYEWETAPDWAAFVQARFEAGSHLRFDWGVLGLDSRSRQEDAPVFEAHVLATTEAIGQAERFLFYSLPEFLLYYLKIEQLLGPRHRRSLAPQARALDAALADELRPLAQPAARLSLRQSEAHLDRIATRLGELRGVATEMAIHEHTARIDYQNAVDILRTACPAAGENPSLLRPQRMYLEQVRHDLEYHRLTIEAVNQAMDLLKLKTEMLRVRFANILASIGAGFGIFLGIGQLTEPNYLKDFMLRHCPWFPLSPYGNLSRALLSSLLAGGTSLLAHWLLNRFLTARAKTTR